MLYFQLSSQCLGVNISIWATATISVSMPGLLFFQYLLYIPSVDPHLPFLCAYLDHFAAVLAKTVISSVSYFSRKLGIVLDESDLYVWTTLYQKLTLESYLAVFKTLKHSQRISLTLVISCWISVCWNVFKRHHGNFISRSFFPTPFSCSRGWRLFCSATFWALWVE